MLFASAGVLMLLLRLFRVDRVSYKSVLKIVILVAMSTTLIGVALAILNLRSSATFILSAVTSFFIFYYVLTRYCHTLQWRLVLGIFALYAIGATLLGMIMIMPIRTLVFTPFVLVGTAMEPTLHNGTYLFVQRIGYSVDRHNIVLWKYLRDGRLRFFVHRVVALPGDQVEIWDNNDVVVNGVAVTASISAADNEGRTPMASFVLNEKEFYVLGDNREASFDSRSVGPIQRQHIEGEVVGKLPDFISGSSW